MRCGRFDRLVDRWVDGRLEEPVAAQMTEHARECWRCASRLEAARGLAAGLTAAPRAHAPRGFADAVMDAVAREALRGRASPGAERAAALVYRRLGLSVLLAGAALTASLFVPRQTWEAIGAAGGGEAVRRALDGADRAVRLTLEAAGEPAWLARGRSR